MKFIPIDNPAKMPVESWVLLRKDHTEQQAIDYFSRVIFDDLTDVICFTHNGDYLLPYPVITEIPNE